MTWVATDDFDSYTTGASLSGGAGGSGWTGNWALVAGTFTAEVAPAGGQGGNAARAVANLDRRIARTFASVTTEVVQWQMLCSVTNPDAFTGVILWNNSAGCMSITFGSDGNLKIYDNTLTYTTLQAYSANTWYTITVDFVYPDQYRAKIDAGAYSSFYTGDNDWTPAGNINKIELRSQSTNANFWFDDIGPESVTPPITDAPELIRTVHSGIRFR